MRLWRVRKGGPTLIDLLAGNMNKPDPQPAPPVKVNDKLHPIQHSSMN